MDIPQYQLIITFAGLVTAVGTAIYTVQKVTKNLKTDKKEFKAEILQESFEADEKNKAELESKINALRTQLDTLSDSVEKDLAHLQQTQEGEIKALGEKIEHLRHELRAQHTSLINLVTKLIDRN